MTTSKLEESESSCDISQFHHTPFYCEENVYLLCKELCKKGIADAQGSDLFVVFISNDKKQIPLWRQKASNRADGVVLWDYHVICVQKKGSGDTPATHLVWDLDSSLAFPCPLATYVLETFCPSFQTFAELRRCFRIVHAPIFLRFFASDRRHMKDSNGNWLRQPPLYQPIVAQDGTVHNLDGYFQIRATDAVTGTGVDVTNAVFTEKLGVVVTENQLEEFFSQIP
ncbi:protein N-terminal glutamine amidohydrolase [Pyrus ussuriensis x Pyrus communis]|uniref:Protein N-terminal glutamine amidohydrolase n=1 Tax=Pyrus ussuriensis x Pyrus communis TaxID=2448454 RepID=A0A5N5HUS5_9ROSA|nr:protein N-terminal glutamine amidohydrolase [Pyrus x bretschneideri]KAB2631288.1 protein N-terminal glutamine amidohydrolase [Pyrus ussuriensis x Pyrus communis]